MDFELNERQREFEIRIKAEVQDLLKHPLIAPLQEMHHADPATTRKIFLELGRRKLISLPYPKELGGSEASNIEQYLFYNEIFGYHRIPIPFSQIAVNTILTFATEEQKKRFVPGILSGEKLLCGGFTESSAGSDLASLKATAVEDGDHFIINGQKQFTTYAEMADYVWFLCRTEPGSDKHHGMSMFLFPIDLPGITVHPFMSYAGHRTNITFYDNVRVPKDCLLGERGKGWSMVMNVFGFERLGLSPHGKLARVLDDVTAWAKETRYNGRSVIDDPWVQEKLIDIAVDTEALKQLNMHAAWMLDQGIVPVADASGQKAWGTEASQRTYAAGLEMLGRFGPIEPGSKWAQLHGRLEHGLLGSVIYSIGGGANEIQRDIVAKAGLGLPRSH